MLTKLKCEICDISFYRYVTEYTKAKGFKHIYCSTKCYSETLKKYKIEMFCKTCEKIIFITESKLKYNRGQYCSKQCHGKAKSNKNGKIVNCNNCGKELWRSNYYLKNLDHYYCNRNCMKEYRFGTGAKIIIKECEYCKKEFETRMIYHKYGQAKFCSRKCWGLSERGVNNPVWKGGKPIEADPFKNSKQYGEWRVSIYKRDNYQCQKCKAINVEVHAHHIFAYKKYPQFRTVIQNGITFCNNCHKLFHTLYGTFNFSPMDTFKFLDSDYCIEKNGELLIEMKGYA